ncbi:MAG: hypothetical protein RIG61_06915 [Deltaproteobacteria bacterium]
MDQSVAPEPELRLPRPSQKLVERKLVRVAQKNDRNFPLSVYEYGNSLLQLVCKL